MKTMNDINNLMLAGFVEGSADSLNAVIDTAWIDAILEQAENYEEVLQYATLLMNGALSCDEFEDEIAYELDTTTGALLYICVKVFAGL